MDRGKVQCRASAGVISLTQNEDIVPQGSWNSREYEDRLDYEGLTRKGAVSSWGGLPSHYMVAESSIPTSGARLLSLRVAMRTPE